MTNDERLNNPLNIEIEHGQTWVGQAAVQKDATFVTFESPEACYRAGRRILRSYEKASIFTLQGAITRYAPPSRNDTEAYIRHMMQFCGWQRGTQYSKNYLMMLKGMTDHEQGRILFPDSVIAAGIAMEEHGMTEPAPAQVPAAAPAQASAPPAADQPTHFEKYGHLYSGGSVAGAIAMEAHLRLGIDLNGIEIAAVGLVVGWAMKKLFPNGVPELS